jgi:hypothetical protein
MEKIKAEVGQRIFPSGVHGFHHIAGRAWSLTLLVDGSPSQQIDSLRRHLAASTAQAIMFNCKRHFFGWCLVWLFQKKQHVEEPSRITQFQNEKLYALNGMN